MRFEHVDPYFTRFEVTTDEQRLVVDAVGAGLAEIRRLERHTQVGTIKPTSKYTEELLGKVASGNGFSLDRDEIEATQTFLLDQADAATIAGLRAPTQGVRAMHEDFSQTSQDLAQQFGPAIRPRQV